MIHFQSHPFVPYEFTVEGFLQRLNAYIENQQFCDMMKFHTPEWPPNRCQRIILAPFGTSCLDACQQKGKS
jgi:alpha-1,3(6)-mannosylglycoprotein beta-1,6-N-acetyl-glucosaminyltransferase